MTSAASESVSPPRTLAGMPAWLAFSLLTILLWGAWGVTSKIASEGVDANTNQVFFTFGLLPLVVWIWCAMRFRPRADDTKRSWIGIGWAFITGILGGTGNIAFFHALVAGGKVSIVAPVTALFPLVTVILAVAILHERLSLQQKCGLALALVAIYLLSM